MQRKYPFWSFTWKLMNLHTIKTSQKLKTPHCNLIGNRNSLLSYRSDKYTSYWFHSLLSLKSFWNKKSPCVPTGLDFFSSRCFLISLVVVLLYSFFNLLTYVPFRERPQSLIPLPLVVSQDYIIAFYSVIYFHHCSTSPQKTIWNLLRVIFLFTWHFNISQKKVPKLFSQLFSV